MWRHEYTEVSIRTMKRHLILPLILLFVLAVGSSAFAAQQALSIAPFGFIDGLVSAEYEWAKSYGSTWVVQGGFRSSGGQATTVFGFGTHAYLTNVILDGPYIGAHGIAVTSKAGSDNAPVNSFEFIASGRAGMKLAFDSILFDIAINFNAPLFKAGEGGTALGASEVTSNWGIGIGYMW